MKPKVVFLKDEPSFIEKLPARDPSPEFALEFVELCERLFLGLEDEHLRRVGWLKIEGFTDQEIADQLGCARRTIQRKVERIRRNWQDLTANDDCS